MQSTLALALKAVEPRPTPFVKWAGGKRRLMAQIVPRMPRRFRCFHEPFIGGGALMFRLLPHYSYISDANPELANLYRVIKHKPSALLADLPRHVNSRDYFMDIRALDRQDGFYDMPDVARASRFLYLNKTTFNGMVRYNAKGQFNGTFGKYKNPTMAVPQNIFACHHALQRSRIACSSFMEVEKVAKEGDFVYFDPPYIPLSDTANFVGYSKDGFSMDDQVALRDLCLRLDQRGVFFMVSNSHSTSAFKLYDHFFVHTVWAPRSNAGSAGSRGMVREILVTNY